MPFLGERGKVERAAPRVLPSLPLSLSLPPSPPSSRLSPEFEVGVLERGEVVPRGGRVQVSGVEAAEAGQVVVDRLDHADVVVDAG